MEKTRRIIILHGTEESLNGWIKSLDCTVAESEDKIEMGVLTSDQREVVLEAIEDHIESLSQGLKLTEDKNEIEEINQLIKEGEKIEEML